MPGTVQVSILELTGLPSSKSSSSMTIKVSLGKHTCEAEGVNGDFLLPLATLRDNLVVKVHDTEGNEIAHTGVKSRLIAEKGSWDDLFPLEGGGHVHMKLKFSLSEEERNRIRSMRESALKKKQEELLNKNKTDLQAAVAVASSGGRNEMLSTAAISDEVRSLDLSVEASSIVVSSNSSSNPSISSASIQVKDDDQLYDLTEQSTLEKAPSTTKEDDQRFNLTEQSTLEKAPSTTKEDDHRFNLTEQSTLAETPIKVKEDDPQYILKEQSPLEKTPSEFKDDDQCYKLQEQIPLEKACSAVQEDDLRYNLNEQSPLEKPPSKVQEDDPRYNLKEESPLEKTSMKVKGDNPRYNSEEQSPWEKTPRKIKDDPRYNLKERSPLEKTPSKVRKTVAAFESSLLSQGRMITVKAQSGREITDAHSKEETSESISAQNAESLECRTERVLDPFSKRLQEHPTSTRDETGPTENRSTSYEPKDVNNMEDKSKEISDLRSDENQPSNPVTQQEYASGVPSLSETQRDNHLKNPHDRLSTEMSGRRRRCSCRNFHGWIFLEEEICSCLASNNRMVIDLLEDYSVNPKTYPGKLVDESVTSSKDGKRSGVTKRPESSHSSGDGASRGPNGQVMKIVIMVGFGLLVLFTRKSKSR